jgi:ATP-binding cassette, subfamily B, bacterial MsbA
MAPRRACRSRAAPDWKADLMPISKPPIPYGGKGLRLWHTLVRLFRMARSYWWAAGISTVLLFLGSLLEGAVFPLTLGLVLFAANPAFENQTMGGVHTSVLKNVSLLFTSRLHLDARSAFFFFLAVMFVCYLVKCLANGFQSYLSQLFAQRLIFKLRGRLHAHLMRLPSSFFESRQTGDLMSRVTSDINILQGMVSNDLIEAIRSPITALASLVLIFKLNSQLSLIAFAIGPLIAYAIMTSSRKMRRITREVQRRLGQLNAHLQERLSAVRVVQLFTREDYEIARFDALNERNITANLRAVKLGAILYPGIEFIAFLGLAVALLFAGIQMLNRGFAIPDLIAFLFGAQKVGAGLIKIGRIRLAMDQSLAAGERVFEVLDTESDIKEDPQPITLPRLQGRVDFRQVSFRYPTGEEVLRDINLEISPGEIIALVGPSGAGKTSLVNLIPRFYDPTRGGIEVDGTDIRKVSLYSLRSQIGIVPQETTLFDGTIRENIAYGRLEATQDEIVAAAQAANADEFIRALGQGYDTPAGERGLRLSGGQRQRIAIARALLKDPRILILDEPTSSLDTASEELVLEALGRLMEGRTTVVIAHRITTIRNADRILVLSGGRGIEQGNHQKLIADGGLYSRLYKSHGDSNIIRDEPLPEPNS